MTEAGLLRLLRLLNDAHYHFTAVTPATHARILARPCKRPQLRDIFGWSRQFTADDLDPAILQCLEECGALYSTGGMLRSALRVASLGGNLFIHSAFPTTAADAVFLGPDTYRFTRWLLEQWSRVKSEPRWILDMGTGSGAAAIIAARLFPAARVTALDVNERALELADVNARAAGVSIELLHASRLPAGPDVVIANPPYLIDVHRRAYRDGGGLLGGQVALDWVEQALQALAQSGSMLLYTGAAMVNGESPLLSALRETCASASAELSVDEIDPDVFGEELAGPAYATVERIAAVGVTIRRR